MMRKALLGSITGPSPDAIDSLRRLCLPLLALVLALSQLAWQAPARAAALSMSSTQAEASSADSSSMEEELRLRRRMMEQPEVPEVYLELADQIVSRGATDEALSILAAGANRFLGSGEAKKAIAVLSKAVELSPDHPEIQFLLGRAYTQNRDFESAEAPLRRAIELGIGDPTALVFLGAILWESGRMEEAEPVYRQAVEATGRAYMPLSQLGRLLLWQGRYEEAVGLLQEASMRDPRAVGTLFDLAEALRGAGQTEEAVAAYRRVASLAPDLTKGHYGLAMLLARTGDREGSQKEFAEYQRLILAEEVRQRQSDLEVGEIDRAGLMIREGRVEEAIAHLESLEETVEVLLAIAQAYKASGNLAAALESLQRAVVADPSRQDVRQLLASLRMEMARGQ
jgi:Flp pilus assembly protein TadD